jgi:hypothetical protein
MHTLDALWVLLVNHILFLLRRVHLQKRSQIPATVTIVWGRPYCRDIFVLEQFLVTLLHQLVGPGNETQPVVVVELVDHFRSEQPAHAPVVLRPPLDVLRVRPHQISKGPFSRYLLKPVYLPDLIKSVDIRRQPSVDAEYVISIN